MQLLMKHALSLLSLFFLLALALLAQSDSAVSAAPVQRPSYGQKVFIPGIPNAGRITESLYRGAQPRKEGFTELRKLGITTIIDLRSEDLNTIQWERRLTESLGMRFVQIPVGRWSAPSDEQVAEFLSIVGDHPQQEIFVHCHLGEDRTGVFIAVYRMGFDQWTAEQATKEMYYFGFNGFWHPAMKSFVRDFPPRLDSNPAFRSSRKAES
jgi:tyrosine-protein phosphatase SIW14